MNYQNSSRFTDLTDDSLVKWEKARSLMQASTIDDECVVTGSFECSLELDPRDHFLAGYWHRPLYSCIGSGKDQLEADLDCWNHKRQIDSCIHDFLILDEITGDSNCEKCKLLLYDRFMPDLLYRSMQLAGVSHEGQFRKYSNQPYIVHPVGVFLKVKRFSKELPFDQRITLCSAACLHDVIEDSEITKDFIAKFISPDVAELVFELTNPSKNYPEKKRAERKKIDRDHLKEASDGAKLIKTMDRICNLSDLKGCHDKKFIQLYLQESELLFEALDIKDESILKIISKTMNSLKNI